MTTNQTIDGVPCADLEAALKADAVIYEITRLNKPTEKGD